MKLLKGPCICSDFLYFILVYVDRVTENAAGYQNKHFYKKTEILDQLGVVYDINF